MKSSMEIFNTLEVKENIDMIRSYGECEQKAK